MCNFVSLGPTKNDVGFVFSGNKAEAEVKEPFVFVTGYAWNVESMKGVTAWVRIDGGGGGIEQQTLQVEASSANMVKIRAGLLVLGWAISYGISEVCIHTERVVVHDLQNPDNANPLLQTALIDFCSLRSFMLLKLIDKM